MFESFRTKIVAAIMSFFMAIGSLFGFSAAPEENGGREIKNVIYLIGDGMGFNHLQKTKKERNVSLVMESFPIKGSSRTRSLSSSVTDSAAGGTALSTGVRTGNSMVGVYYTEKDIHISYPKNITELCKERGMLTGVITTDATSGATPASFSAHSSDRDNTQDITDDQLSSGIDIIWGKANGLVTESIAEENGFVYVQNYNDMMALEEGSRSFAQFDDSLWKLDPVKDSPNLQQMAERAVDLLDDTEEGFFLMIEGAHIDKHSHNEDSANMTIALQEFDRTVESMLSYAEADGQTLVVVTADHETGAITPDGDSYVYTSSSHSSADVPVFVYGSEDIISDGETLKNCEIPVRIAGVLGFKETEFPVSVYKQKLISRPHQS